MKRHTHIYGIILLAFFAGGSAGAEESMSPPVVAGEMSADEYATYRARIQRHLESAAQAVDKNEMREQGNQEPAKTDPEKTTRPMRHNPAREGYGQGYHMRHEHETSRMGGRMGMGMGR